MGPNDKHSWKEKMARDTIGIDISKDRIDAFWHSRSEECSLPNSGDGGYHRGLKHCFGQVGRSFIKLNPKLARRFTQAIGRLARTDSVDAQMFARMGIDP